MWFRLMMLAFAFNGVCTFGVRILAGSGVPDRYGSAYLMVWYIGGALVLGSLFAARRLKPRSRDALIGGALGTASFAGQTSITMALLRGLPGSSVYPVALSGGLFVVVLAGVLLFKEPIGPFGAAGIALGISAVALLSL